MNANISICKKRKKLIKRQKINGFVLRYEWNTIGNIRMQDVR